MSTRKSVRTPVVFDFSRVAESVDIPPKPTDGMSQDKIDAMKKARNIAYDMCAGLKLDAFEGVIHAHAGDPETLTRAFYTWVAQMGMDYSIARVARDSGKGDVTPREDTRIENALKALGITRAQYDALQARRK